jgi:hypothetical protein
VWYQPLHTNGTSKFLLNSDNSTIRSRDEHASLRGRAANHFDPGDVTDLLDPVLGHFGPSVTIDGEHETL